MDFKKYMHLERFTSNEVDGLLDGECHVFPKLDGTNASIWLGDNGVLHTGSRTRVLSEEGVLDNAGFNTYVQHNKSLFMPFFTRFPNARLYGEWLVKHTVQYEPSAYRRFYVFDVLHKNVFCTYEDYQPILDSYGIDYTPLLCKVYNYSGTWREILDMNTFCLVPGTKGEGIVVKRYDFVNRYGRSVFAKVLDESFSQEKRGTEKVANTHEEGLAIEYITKHTVDKERSKLLLQESSRSLQGRLIEAVWYDFCKEIFPDIMLKSKLTINIPLLRNEVLHRTKFYASDIF